MIDLTRAYYAIKHMIEAQTWKITFTVLLFTTGLNAQKFEAYASLDQTVVPTEMHEFATVSYNFSSDANNYIIHDYLYYSYGSMVNADANTFFKAAGTHGLNEIATKHPKLRITNERFNYIFSHAEHAIYVANEIYMPASVVLAIGILESRSGLCPAAQKANIFFNVYLGEFGTSWYKYTKGVCDKRGIPLFKQWDDHMWRYAYGSKDIRGNYEMFKKYIHHEDWFTKGSFHYEQLFKLGYGDYMRWTHGLQELGYATDKQYAAKLNAIIKECALYEFDTYIWDTMDPKKRFEVLYPEVSTMDVKFKTPHRDLRNTIKRSTNYVVKKYKSASKKVKRYTKAKSTADNHFEALKRKIGGNRS